MSLGHRGGRLVTECLACAGPDLHSSPGDGCLLNLHIRDVETGEEEDLPPRLLGRWPLELHTTPGPLIVDTTTHTPTSLYPVLLVALSGSAWGHFLE